MKKIADIAADKPRTVPSTDLSYMSVVYPMSEFSTDRSVRCLSGICLSRFCPLSGFCPDFSKKLCPLSVCPSGQGQDRTVRTFAVLVRRRLILIPLMNHCTWKLNFKFKMFAFFNIQDWPVSLNSVMWLLIVVYERPISIVIFIFFKRRIFIRNESVL